MGNLKTQISSIVRLAIAGILLFPCLAVAWEPGIYPLPPQRMQSSDFSVNRSERNDVVAFWHAVYQASEGYENRIGWTGDFSGNNGTTSSIFQEDVERRLNYFRAMCGVSANAGVNTNSTVFIDPNDAYKPSSATLKSTASQNAALVILRNYNSDNGANPALSHDLSRNLTGWSSSAWNAAAKGSFAFGLYGPGAITEYMIERISSANATSSWNTEVGHRRWNLYPSATDYASGDQPGSGVNRPPTNVLYVIQNPSEISQLPAPEFVAYPAAGFFPVNINSPYWSLSASEADFSAASVKMTDASGNDVRISNIRRSNVYGDPAIIWEVGSAAATRSVIGDTTFNVFVSGISTRANEVNHFSNHNYSVTLINPDIITDDQSIFGADSIPSNRSGIYSFKPPVGAEAVRMIAFKKESKALRETAEKSGRVIDRTAGNYSFRAKSSSFDGYAGIAGKTSFHLTFPNSYDPIRRGVLDQSFELNQDLIAKSKAKLTFRYRRGFMTKSSVLAAEMSSDGGVSWKRLGSPIRGISDTELKSTVSIATRSIPQSSTPIRIRFRYFRDGEAIYTHEAAPKSPTGIFIDEIKTKNCDNLRLKRATVLPSKESKFEFNSQTVGSTLTPGSQWQLRLQTQLGGKWFPYGPTKSVTITAP